MRDDARLGGETKVADRTEGARRGDEEAARGHVRLGNLHGRSRRGVRRAPRAKRGSDGVARAGEFGAAFKFPWEVEASDKTAIGHIIPVVVVLGLYAVPLAYGFASGNISF